MLQQKPIIYKEIRSKIKKLRNWNLDQIKEIR